MYNLAKQALAKKLLGGGGVLSCLALHPGGDHVLVGSDDKRVAWYDLDLSTKPYKALRYHSAPPRAVAFHRSYPLFASAADDGTVQVRGGEEGGRHLWGDGTHGSQRVGWESGGRWAGTGQGGEHC